MGRLSALILQAVCLTGWLAERQADAYVIAANRRDGEAAKAVQLSISRPEDSGFWLSASPMMSIKVIGGERADISKVVEGVDHLTHQRAGVPLPVPVTRAWSVKGGCREEWKRNHMEQSIFSDWLMCVGGGYLFYPQWHLKDTLQCCPDNSYEPACPTSPCVGGQGWVTSYLFCLCAPVGVSDYFWHNGMCLEFHFSGGIIAVLFTNVCKELWKYKRISKFTLICTKLQAHTARLTLANFLALGVKNLFSGMSGTLTLPKQILSQMRGSLKKQLFHEKIRFTGYRPFPANRTKCKHQAFFHISAPYLCP